MLVKNYTSLTINAGHTMITDQPCRGMLIYVSGDCIISGSLSMRGRGPAADPTAAGASDSNAVSSNGLQIPFVTAAGTDVISASATLLNGCGTAARSAIANHPSLSSDGKTITFVRQGASGGAGALGSNGATGSSGSTGQTGGGGGGCNDGNSVGRSLGGNGSYGSCWGGGSGGGGITTSGGIASDPDALAWGYRGGNSIGSAGSQGGVGNPAGTSTGGSQNGVGTGGLIILIVGGNLTINSGGYVDARGVDGGGTAVYAAGGASGGGNILIAYRGTYTNSGTVSAAGGTGVATSSGGQAGRYGGTGGAGSVQTLQVS
jgi:hypothetical protein